VSAHGLPSAAAMLAEEDVLGAILSAASYDVAAGHRLLDRVLATGLVEADFYRPSLGHLFAQLRAMRSVEMPLDPVSVAYELERAGAEPHVLALLHKLATQVTGLSPAGRWAGLVHQEAAERRNGLVRRAS
jgi:replicative DNA helicase